MSAPWDDPRLMRAAANLAVDVRDKGPGVVAATVARMSRTDAAAIVACLAQLVDLEQTIPQLLAWRDEPSVPRIPQVQVRCNKGHLLTPENRVRNGRTPGGRRRWRCRRCLIEQRAAA